MVDVAKCAARCLQEASKYGEVSFAYLLDRRMLAASTTTTMAFGLDWQIHALSVRD